MNAILQGYIEDLKDNLSSFNTALIDIKCGRSDADIINTIFHVAHTIKDNSAAMEFEQIEKVMHTMEDILYEIKSGTRQFSESIYDILYACHDFLENCLVTIERNNSDTSLDISRMLELFSSINVNYVESNRFLHPSKVMFTEDISILPYINVDPKIWQVIAGNLERGFSPYSLEVDFSEGCIMKSVRAWLIFQKIETFSMLLYSNPARPDDESFKNGVFSFEGTTMQFLILTEKDIAELIEDLEKLDDVSSVRSYCIHQKEITIILESHRMKEKILKSITDISIQLVDIESTSNSYLIESVVELFETISNLNLTKTKSYIKSASIQIAKILREKAELNQDMDIRCLGVITQAFHIIETVLKTPDNNQAHELFREKIINLFIDELKINDSYSTQRIGDILQSKGILKEDDVHEILEKQKQSENLKFGQIAVKENKASAYEVISALKDQIPCIDKKDTLTKQEGDFIQIPAANINKLLHMINELLTFNSQLEQQIEKDSSCKLEMINTLLKETKLMKEIQTLSMSFEAKP
ncbi:Hpt domain-containing protein [Pseudobacteroides cellulosolvens]|uniref:Hpt protein n=1 Tax=Pseudobacteroides cellulosolvens ATCC 35603 = DSM 2933 TaxID=398512 RepID=A0A0L6JXF0_9FIRM|nr:Hpt domain-containing protein [Pseudobacteroides cellulosolvens]KNY30122.1 Hpt protein [Pseudobacteroides cellulosolvens ATCC 35603 = DSM 2933]